MSSSSIGPSVSPTQIGLAVLVAALGYFVDIYDLILFSIVRVQSLTAIGVEKKDLMTKGILLLNMQMGGMLIGGILWGILGDKKGRLSVLFGSILMYSLANIANGFVTSVPSYAILRFIAGVGLAGELGAGVTLVAELLPKETRGVGTTIIASVGLLGAGLAGLVAKTFDWRTAYFIGGALGLALLALRLGVRESALFQGVASSEVQRGNFFALFRNRRRAIRFLSLVFVGLPIWYCVGILVTFSPEIGKAMGMTEVPPVGESIVSMYVGGAFGDLLSGLLSQYLKKRKRVIFLFFALLAFMAVVYFTWGTSSPTAFRRTCFMMGFGIGYWALFVTMAAEQFGTNLRSTTTTTVPNFVRGALVPLTLAFEWVKHVDRLGVRNGAIAVGIGTFSLALIALMSLEETFGKDLDFIEE